LHVLCILRHRHFGDVSCFGAGDGYATVVATGGVTPYTYLWDDGTSQTTSTSIGLSGGVYEVTVTDGNGCTATASVTIDEPAELTAIAETIQHVDCQGASTGIIEVIPAGGTPPYTYLWSNGSTDMVVTGVPAGIYT